MSLKNSLIILVFSLLLCFSKLSALTERSFLGDKYFPEEFDKNAICRPSFYIAFERRNGDPCSLGDSAEECRLACIKCPLFAVCDGNQILKCLPLAFVNSTNINDLTSCAPCLAGHECNGTHAEPCASGDWASLGKGFCSSCSGLITDDQSFCEPCPENHVCLNGLNFGCKAGYYQHKDQKGDFSCKKCPANASCESKYYFSCLEGYFHVKIDGEDHCHPCANSVYVPETLSCYLCPYYLSCEDGELRGCQASYYLANSSLPPSETNCLACPEGFYCLQNQLISCPAGHYCPANSDLPIRCPNNYFSQTESSCCEACPPHHVNDPTFTFCTKTFVFSYFLGSFLPILLIILAGLVCCVIVLIVLCLGISAKKRRAALLTV